jgi:hypothetical protein
MPAPIQKPVQVNWNATSTRDLRTATSCLHTENVCVNLV